MSHFVVRLYKGKKRITERERERGVTPTFDQVNSVVVLGCMDLSVERCIVLLYYYYTIRVIRDFSDLQTSVYSKVVEVVIITRSYWKVAKLVVAGYYDSPGAWCERYRVIRLFTAKKKSYFPAAVRYTTTVVFFFFLSFYNIAKPTGEKEKYRKPPYARVYRK